MATASQVTAAYRQQNNTLRAATVRDLLRLWPALDWNRLDSTYPAWALAVGKLVAANRQTAAGLAAAYLQAFRQAEGVSGPAPVVMQAGLDAAQTATALRVTSVVAVKQATLTGATKKQAMDSAFVQSSGAVTRLILDAGRNTVRASLAADSKARGWQRVTSGRACQFCQMLAGRGAVYSADTADFHSHDHCGCTAQPVYL